LIVFKWVCFCITTKMKLPKTIEPVKRLDISYADYARCCASASDGDRSGVELEVERFWSPGREDAMVALSVRTGVDAYLAALRLPIQSQVLMSAVTIPDMVKIVEAHGLVPIAIDVDFDTLAPKVDLMEKALNEKTKVVLVSHIFGSIADMSDILSFAEKHGLKVIEDCAEAYCGPDYTGDDRSDISLFSFGSIKTETALGGALLRVKDPKIRDDMRGLMEHYAVQPLGIFSKRLFKYAAFSLVLNEQRLYSAFVRGLNFFGKDHLDVLLANTRGFIGQDLFQSIRLRPPVALVMLLKRRLENFDRARLAQRQERCALAARMLGRVPGIGVPGTRANPHYHWLFPVNVQDPERISKLALQGGFDATTGTTSLVCIDNVVTEKNATYRAVYNPGTATATKLMENILYLPIDADTSPDTVSRMVSVLSVSLGEGRSHL